MPVDTRLRSPRRADGANPTIESVSALPELRAWERLEHRTALVYAGLALLVSVAAATAFQGIAAPLFLTIPACVVLTGAVYLWGTRRVRRRQGLLRQPFPPEWEAVLQREVAFFRALNPDGQQRFRRHVQLFLGEKRITGISVDADTTTRVLVAASAIIPIFGFPGWEWHQISEVLIYPSRFTHDFAVGDRADHQILGMVGTGSMNRLMILSKPDLLAGFRNPGDKRNVGLHEFAHLVDLSDGAIDGVPMVGLDERAIGPWVDLVRRKMQEIEEGTSDIHPYALTNEAEFFAVASEYFFERPGVMQQKHPKLYAALERTFNQDLRSRLAAPRADTPAAAFRAELPLPLRQRPQVQEVLPAESDLLSRGAPTFARHASPRATVAGHPSAPQLSWRRRAGQAESPVRQDVEPPTRWPLRRLGNGSTPNGGCTDQSDRPAAEALLDDPTKHITKAALPSWPDPVKEHSHRWRSCRQHRPQFVNPGENKRARDEFYFDVVKPSGLHLCVEVCRVRETEDRRRCRWWRHVRERGAHGVKQEPEQFELVRACPTADHGPATRAQHAAQFREPLRPIRKQHQGEGAGGPIKAGVFDGERLAIHDLAGDIRGANGPQTLAEDVDHLRREVSGQQ